MPGGKPFFNVMNPACVKRKTFAHVQIRMTFIKNYSLIFCFVACSLKLPAQSFYGGVLAGWDFHSLPGGVNNFGASPFAPASLQTNLITTGLVRGGGIGTNATGAARGWGGNTFTAATETAATAAGDFVSLTLTVGAMYQVSYTNINELDYRRSSTGPANGVLQYQIGTNSFTDITNFSYSVSTSTGGSLGPVGLSGIAALQNVPAGVPVTFRIVSWGGTSTNGTWYLFDVVNTTAPDLSIQGTVAMSFNSFLSAYDSGPGFVGGENLVLTNTSGASISVWSSATPSLSVTNWSLVGQMSELPLGTSGNSKYGINLNPSVSPTYYIFAQTNIGLYPPTEPLVWLTTSDFSDYTVTGTNAGIRADGVFAIPAAPVLVASPAGTNVFAGKNVSLNASASATGTLNYQWYQNGAGLADGAGISGSQSSLLSFTPAATNQSGSYFVVVTNQLGSVTSSVAILNVVPVPALNFSSSTNGFALNALNGAVNSSYVIQMTTNLAPPVFWSPLQTNLIGTNGQIYFNVTNGNAPGVFYRVQIP
jgi:hypothetical protein